MNKTITLNDIKYDLLKIIEPHDGQLETGKPRAVRRLFVAYLNDLQKDREIFDFSVDTTDRNNAITFDISVRFSPYRSPKKIKIHVGTYQHPWIAA